MKVRAFFISLLIVPALSFSAYQVIAGQKTAEDKDWVSEAIEFLGLSGDSRTKDGGG